MIGTKYLVKNTSDVTIEEWQSQKNGFIQSLDKTITILKFENTAQLPASVNALELLTHNQILDYIQQNQAMFVDNSIL